MRRLLQTPAATGFSALPGCALLVIDCCTPPAPLGLPWGRGGGGYWILLTGYLSRGGGFIRHARPTGRSRFDRNAGRGFRIPRLGSRFTKLFFPSSTKDPRPGPILTHITTGFGGRDLWSLDSWAKVVDMADRCTRIHT